MQFNFYWKNISLLLLIIPTVVKINRYKFCRLLKYCAKKLIFCYFKKHLCINKTFCYKTKIVKQQQ